MGVPREDLEHCTQQGAQQLQDGHLQQALEAFSVAYNKSMQTSNTNVQRACAFNLGAVHIALREVDKGLEMLHKAVPSTGESSNSPNADLFFNFGLAYELKGISEDAVKYFELALEEYVACGNEVMEAETAMRVGTLYMSLSNHLQAMRAYTIAAAAYKKVKQVDRATMCMCYQASASLKARKLDDALVTADNCMILCQQYSRDQVQSKGKGADSALWKVYNELGLLYTQCQDHGKAATCFELALPMCRGAHIDGRRKAVVIQNLGAVYNSLGDYKRGIKFHKSAAQIHARLGNRSAQGQCFANLAYALSQLGDTEGVEESYLHALQAARDADDKHAQWQALEGLGAAAFTQLQVPRAVRLYKEALSTLSGSSEKNEAAQERIVCKLSSALQWQLGTNDTGKETLEMNNDVNILVNDQPRPPTRDEMRIINELQMLRKPRRTGRQPSYFDTIALGVGEYDSDSDLSIHRNRRSRRKHVGRDTVDQGAVVPQQSSQTSVKQKPKTVEKVTRRTMSKRLNSVAKLRRGNQTLLRYEDHDSEDEWKHNMQHMMRRDSSDTSVRVAEGYRQRLHPPSSPDEDGVPRLSARQSELLSQIPITQDPGTATEEDKDDRRADSVTSGDLQGLEGLGDTNEGLRGYREVLRKLDQIETASDAVSSSEEDSAGSSQTISDSMGGLKSMPKSWPPPPPSTTPPQRPLLETYEKPVDVTQDSSESHDERRTLSERRYSAKNYFREDIPDKMAGTMRISVPKEDDPNYMTIRTIREGPSHRDPQPSTSTAHLYEEVPPLPPPRSSHPKPQDTSRAEGEEFLSEYQQKWSENTRDKVGPTGEDQAKEKTKGRKVSRQLSTACVMM